MDKEKEKVAGMELGTALEMESKATGRVTSMEVSTALDTLVAVGVEEGFQPPAP